MKCEDDTPFAPSVGKTPEKLAEGLSALSAGDRRCLTRDLRPGERVLWTAAACPVWSFIPAACLGGVVWCAVWVWAAVRTGLAVQGAPGWGKPVVLGLALLPGLIALAVPWLQQWKLARSRYFWTSDARALILVRRPWWGSTVRAQETAGLYRILLERSRRCVEVDFGMTEYWLQSYTGGKFVAPDGSVRTGISFHFLLREPDFAALTDLLPTAKLVEQVWHGSESTLAPWRATETATVTPTADPVSRMLREIPPEEE